VGGPIGSGSAIRGAFINIEPCGGYKRRVRLPSLILDTVSSMEVSLCRIIASGYVGQEDVSESNDEVDRNSDILATKLRTRVSVLIFVSLAHPAARQSKSKVLFTSILWYVPLATIT
jgi:hypothetical protein